MRYPTTKTLFKIVALQALMAGAAQAEWIIPVGATASSETLASYPAMQAINGSGLSEESASATHAVGNFTWMWVQGDSVPISEEWITVDLGGLYNLTDVYLWQFSRGINGDANRGVQQFDILVSANGVDFTEVASDLVLAKAPADANNKPIGPLAAQNFALIQSGVRYVQFGIDSTYESSTGANDWLGGIGEIRFEGSAVSGPAAPPKIIEIAIDEDGNVILTLEGSVAGLTVQQSSDLTPGSFSDVPSTPVDTNKLQIDAVDVDPNSDGSDFFRVRD